MDINKAIQLAFKHYQTGDLKQTERICKEILKKQPNNLDMLYFLGIVCYQRQKYDSSIKYIKKYLQFSPTNSDAYYNLGQAFYKNEQFDDAIKCYQKALKLNPNFIDACINLGNLFQKKGQLDEAITYYHRAIEINPNLAGAYYNLGNILQEKEQIDEAIFAYQKAIELNPNYADAYHDLGYAFQCEGRLEEAIKNYQKALRINPNLCDAYNNLGRVLQEQGHLDEAVTSYKTALQINLNFAEAHCNMSMVFLLLGNFKQGWKEYEWRWKLKNHSRYNFSQPLWDGSDIAGRTIFLYAEQGFGDTIQFIRYTPLVAERGAEIIVECQKELKALLENVKGVGMIIAREEQTPPFDIHCPLLSLPLLLETTLETIPADIPYISVDPMVLQKWKEKIHHDNSYFKAGLVWSGNPKNTKLWYKSFPLDTFAPLAELKDITFFSLQKGKAAEQAKNPPAGMKLVDYTDEIQDFSDTAALIKNLDLVISVDTAVAHLAGALGKPVWTLLPFSPDWRWMLNREDSHWYPTMRLFRQPTPGDWKSVIVKISDELKKKSTVLFRYMICRP